MKWLKVTGLLLLSWVVLLVVILYWARNPWRDSARYRRAFNDLESSSATVRKRALHELLDPIDYPLPEVKRQTRLAIGMMLGDEDKTVRQTAGMRLAGVAVLIRQDDPDAYRRIIVALSRAMAEDPSSDSRYSAAYCLEWHVVGRGFLDPKTGTICEPFWRQATKDNNKDVAEFAKTYLSTVR